MHDNNEPAFQPTYLEEARETLNTMQAEGIKQIEDLTEEIEKFQSTLSKDIGQLKQTVSNIESELQTNIDERLTTVSESLTQMVKETLSEMIGESREKVSDSTVLDTIQSKLQELTEQSSSANQAAREQLTKINDLVQLNNKVEKALRSITQCTESFRRADLNSSALKEQKSLLSKLNQSFAKNNRRITVYLLLNILFSAATIAYLIVKIG